MRSEPTVPVSLAGIARESGGLAVVAMDPREALRALLADAGRDGTGDAALLELQLEVVRTLGPAASGLQVDRDFGFAEVRDQDLLPSSTGVVLTTEELVQRPAYPVEDFDLDAVVRSPDLDLTGVTALRLQVMWRRDDRRGQRVELVRRFAEAAATRNVLSVVEAVVRPTDDELDDGTWNTEAAVREAATELSVVGQSLYVVPVPRGGGPSGLTLDEECLLLGESIAGPWAVLSPSGPFDDVADAVTAACRAGASGFLVGRALWAEIIDRDDVRLALHEVALPRLQRLSRIVDENASTVGDGHPVAALNR